MHAQSTQGGVGIPSLMLATPTLDLAGPDKVVSLLAAGLVDWGWNVQVAVTDASGALVGTLPASVEVLRIASAPLRVLQRYPSSGLLKVVRQHRPDVLLTTLRMNVTAGLIRPLMGKSTRLVQRPANHTSQALADLPRRGVKHLVAERLAARLLKTSDLVIAQSELLARELGSGGFEGPIRVVGNPVIRPQETRSHKNLAGRPSLLAVGRLSPQKGFDILLAALPSLLEVYPDAHLHIVGTGPDEGELRKLARLEAVEGQATFHGFQSSALEFMRAADFLVAPSRYEGFSNVIVEALSVGTPVIATEVGAAREVLESTGGGVLVAPDSPSALSDALIDATRQSSRFDGQATIERLLSRWSLERICEEYDSALRSLL